MGFITILIATALSIAGSAAFFSIYGLARIFTGSFWPVVIMATSLEAGKLVSASYLYRYWKKISFIMKSYLIAAILILMLITSAGIFGFLSAAYQQDVLPIKQNEQQIALLTGEKEELERLKIERLERRKQIDADIASLPNNYITGRQRLMKSYGPELEQLRIDIASYTDQIRQKTLKISELKNATLEQEAHVGPIIYIAAAFDSEVDDATKWLILLIIFAFDPLAVVLTIGANMAILERKKQLGHVEHGLEIFEEMIGRDDELHELDRPTKPHQHELIDEPEPQVTSADQLIQDEFETEQDYQHQYDEEPEPEYVDEEPEPEPEPEYVDEEPKKVDEPRTTETHQPDPMIPSQFSAIPPVDMNRIEEMLNQLKNRQLTPEEMDQKAALEQMLRRNEVTQRVRNPNRE